MSGAGIEFVPNHNIVMGIVLRAEPNLTEDIGRVFTYQIPPGKLQYVPYQTFLGNVVRRVQNDPSTSAVGPLRDNSSTRYRLENPRGEWLIPPRPVFIFGGQ